MKIYFSFLRPVKTLLIGVLIGGVVVAGFHSWRNARMRRQAAFQDDCRTWSEYVELLSMERELAKGREDMNLEVMSWSVRLRLTWAKQRAEQSELHSGTIIPLFGEMKSPIWKEHIVSLGEAIDRLEAREKSGFYRNDKQSGKEEQGPKESNVSASDKP